MLQVLEKIVLHAITICHIHVGIGINDFLPLIFLTEHCSWEVLVQYFFLSLAGIVSLYFTVLCHYYGHTFGDSIYCYPSNNSLLLETLRWWKQLVLSGHL